MEQYKSVKEVINKGQLEVNVPVTIIIIGIPLLALYLVPKWIGEEYAHWFILLSFLLGIISAWTWWSYKIVKWRIWAFENVAKENWIELKIKAIEGNLIWHDGSVFEKTEIRSKIENDKIQSIDAEINTSLLHNYQEQEEIYTEVEDDLSIPDRIDYYFDQSKLILSLLSFIFFIGLGILILIYDNPITALILTSISLYYLDWKGLNNLGNKDIQLSVSNEGINLVFTKFGWIEWCNVKNVVVDTDSGILELVIWNKEQSYDITQGLGRLNVQDYDNFLKILNVYVKRYGNNSNAIEE